MNEDYSDDDMIILYNELEDKDVDELVEYARRVNVNSSKISNALRLYRKRKDIGPMLDIIMTHMFDKDWIYITGDGGLGESRKQRGRKLNEHNSQIENAQILLAAQDMVDKLAKMAEDLAGLQTKALMPLVDEIKYNLGQPQSQSFNDAARQHLQTALDSIINVKDAMSDQVLALQTGEFSQTDMETFDGEDSNLGMSDMDNFDGDLGGEFNDAEFAGEDFGNEETGDANNYDEELNDLFSGADEVSGPNNSPVGRAAK